MMRLATLLTLLATGSHAFWPRRGRPAEPVKEADWAKVKENVDGLGDAALKTLYERVWVPFSQDVGVMKKLGLKGSKGLLMYGPPGSGKTYSAEKLARELSPCKFTSIKGPEIMDKHVGEAEKKLRNYFQNPPKFKNRKARHVIIMDEFDTIGKSRSANNTHPAQESIVNQLLALMEGTEEPPVETFVIALTNNFDQLDAALLRPGRFDVHLQVSTPTIEEKVKILNATAKEGIKNGMIAITNNQESTIKDHLGDVKIKTEKLDIIEVYSVEPPEDGAEGKDSTSKAMEMQTKQLIDQLFKNLAKYAVDFSRAETAAVYKEAAWQAMVRAIREKTKVELNEGDFIEAVDSIRFQRDNLEAEFARFKESKKAYGPLTGEYRKIYEKAMDLAVD